MEYKHMTTHTFKIINRANNAMPLAGFTGRLKVDEK